MKSKLMSLIVCGVLAGCGGGSNPDRSETATQTVGTEAMVVASGSDTLTFSSGSVSGTGSVRTTSPFTTVDGEGNFSLTMTLQEGGKVTLVAFSDTSLASGVEIEFSRPSSAGTLGVTLKYGTTTYDASSAFAGVDASAAFKIAVDVHNVEKPAHIIMWNDTAGTADADDFVFNTGTVSGSSPGDGKGTYWGVRLETATVSALAKSDVRYEDE